jgi:hypothetical protein
MIFEPITWYVKISASWAAVRVLIIALVMPDAAKAVLSGANTVSDPVDKAEASPAFVMAWLSNEKLASAATISEMFGVTGSSFLHELKMVELKIPNVIKNRAVCFLKSFMFN